MRGLGFAKVNLSLHVRSPRADGYHPIEGLFQSIDWADELTLDTSREDRFHASGRPVPDGEANLAWRALLAVREHAGSAQRFEAALAKSIPVAAGLGGGSADAAVVMSMVGRMLNVSAGDLLALAAPLGADIPFCLKGGLALVSGIGEVIDSLAGSATYGIGVVVPPVELSTVSVYERWDALGEPHGPTIRAESLPPSLRSHAPLRNDLVPAANAVSRGLVDDWRSELESLWSRPVFMSGSGPAMFGLFVDVDEAAGAVAVAPRGVRAARACQPVPAGWMIES